MPFTRLALAVCLLSSACSSSSSPAAGQGAPSPAPPDPSRSTDDGANDPSTPPISSGEHPPAPSPDGSAGALPGELPLPTHPGVQMPPDASPPDAPNDGPLEACALPTVQPYETVPRLGFSITPQGGRALGCELDMAKPGGDQLQLEGEVVSFESVEGDAGVGALQHLVIDTCPPTATCSSSLVDVRIRSSGHFPHGDLLRTSVGAFVHVHYLAAYSFLCSELLEIDNVGTWHDVPNPRRTSDAILFFGGDGGIPSDFSPAEAFSCDITRVPVNCPSAQVRSNGFSSPGTYAFRFSSPGQSEQPVVAMGEEHAWQLHNQALTLQNLRSYQTDYSDDYWNWAFLILDATP